MSSIRLQKYLAQCGIDSRRNCETYITDGRIKVNGKKVTTLGTKIDPDHNIVTFDGQIVKPKPIIWIMLNKPPEYVSTARDPSGKPSFLELLPKEKQYLFAVGRLDFLSEGLLLITNDGDSANNIIHPRYEIEKEYQVTSPDEISPHQMNEMMQGLIVDEEILSVKSISKISNIGGYWIYSIILMEGKNRHIRKMLKKMNIRVKKLKRIRIGPIQLTSLQTGKWRYLSKEEIDLIEKLTKNHLKNGEDSFF
jgi:pseudouridine synthase